MKIDSLDPVTIALTGTPIPKGRPRVSSFRGKIHIRTPETTKAYEEAVRLTAWSQMRGRNPFKQAVEVTMRFVFAPPASWSNSKRMAAIAGELPHTVKPDTDNCVKAVLDACNLVVFADDALVTKITAEKRYGPASLMVATVKPLEEQV